MNPLTREWVAKAEDDFDDAGRILRAKNRTDFSNACFHAQQCAEKYMKAVLVEAGEPIERIHDLPTLLKQLSTINPLWVDLDKAARTLTDYAVRFRYPGGNVDKISARNATDACKAIRNRMREHLGLGSALPKRRSNVRSKERRIRK